jgi:hypothetical protein
MPSLSLGKGIKESASEGIIAKWRTMSILEGKNCGAGINIQKKNLDKK